MKIKQLCVFLENKKGHLANITEVMSRQDVNVLARIDLGVDGQA